jgi:formylglycine-generating enzyme required for sulfatase activity/tRNA A-37 threonylcarbamoyl transferase component Bud32
MRWNENDKIQDRFIIETILGAGGYGITYRANDTLMKRQVAIKTLDPIKRNEPDFDTEHQKFKDEAKRLAQCIDPHIVRVLDIFYADTEKLWCMVMDCIVGQNLGEIIDDLYRVNRTLPQTEALSYIHQIGAALTLVHSKGMLHRDVKPQNILRETQTNKVVLIDFGLAREFDLAKSRSMTNSRTMGYAPPEQYEERGNFTHALDVYALAATLYTLLTGAVPIDATFRQDYPLKSPQQINPDISTEISTAIMEGMEMFPSNRPQTIAEFLALLAREELAPKVPLPKGDLGGFSKFQGNLSREKYQFESAKLKIVGGKPQITKFTCEAEGFTHKLGNGESLGMVYIPPGKFMMGSPAGEGRDNEKPQHQVTISPFYMSKYPITQAQWRVVAALPHEQRHLTSAPSYFKGNNRPVERVSWHDAVEFCARLSKSTKQVYRLPSEAEWEYACRAGTTTPYYFGETITYELVNHNDSRSQTTDVGIFPPNNFGLYDLHGNVWEWCADTWSDSYAGAPTDGSIWEQANKNQSLLRGGSRGNYPDYCRSAVRYSEARVYAYSYIGFRLVCE